MATPLAAGVGAPRAPSGGKSRRDAQPAGNDRLTDVLLLVSLAACLYAPVRSYFAGGVVAPSLLRRDLSASTVVVTGANTGIGFETARQLAAQNATVVLACRSMERCRNAVAAIAAAHPHVPAARIVAMQLDLADLASVRSFATAVTARFPVIDVLVNNAGAWAPWACGRQRSATASRRWQRQRRRAQGVVRAHPVGRPGRRRRPLPPPLLLDRSLACSLDRLRHFPPAPPQA